MAELVCPKCGSDMRSYERNGITVDQCTGCRGVFLDRGELERLIDAEAGYYAAAGPPTTAPVTDRRDDWRQRRDPDDDDDWDDRRGGRRGGFLEDLFDFG